MSIVYVTITATKGSTPRDEGTVMAVTATGFDGTIGGGALEYAAIAKARKMLDGNLPDCCETIPLGPNLGQCCGGAVTLRFDRSRAAIDVPQIGGALPKLRLAAPRQLWVWGAGHVGRAIVNAALTTDAFEITWIDTANDRFPAGAADTSSVIATRNLVRLAGHAPKDAHHLIVTYSHEIDLALCAALLGRGFAFCGLIGSDTKWARFGKKLRVLGLEPDAITCPIGDKSLGKHPDLIAYGTVKSLMAARQLEATA